MSELYNDLPFLSGRMKIGKVEKLVANLYDKKEYVIHIGNLKLSLNHRLELIKHGDIKLETTKKKKKKKELLVVRTKLSNNPFFWNIH